ncbi:hypothetical protein HN51_059631 [Arachis hypogaea]
MEERRRGCSVANEAPPPLLGLVAIAVLPPSGSVAKPLRHRSSLLHRRRPSPSSYPLSPALLIRCELQKDLNVSVDDYFYSYCHY